MSYQSKFIERFDIDPSDSILQDMLYSSSPRNSVYSAPELNQSENSLKGTKPIEIPSKKYSNKYMSITPPDSPTRTSKFKQFFNTLSRKKDGSRPSI